MSFKAGEVAVDIKGNVIPLTRDLRVAQVKVAKSAAKMESSFVKSFKGVKKAAKIGVAGIALVGVAAAALAIPIIRTGAQFEQTMTVVKGVMRATEREFTSLTAVAKQMGETTEFTASQAAEGLKFMGMAGFTAAQAIQALPGVLDLATAGQIDLGEASDIATNALTAMKLSVGELGRVNDVFVATVNRSNTNIRMMAESFKYAAPVASAFGYDVEQLSALIGALGNAGVQGSMAGTQLAFAFTKSAKAAKELGLGPGASFIDVLRKMKEEGWGAQKVLKVFSVRAGRAALILKDSIPTYERLLKATRAAKGEAKALADLMRSTVIGRWRELKSAVESVAIDAFTAKSSDLSREIQNLTRVVRENKETLVGLASAAVWVAEKFVGLANVIRRMTSGDELKRQLEVGLISPEQLLEVRQRGGDLLKILDQNKKDIATGKKAWEHELRKRPEMIGLPSTKLTTALELSIAGKDIPQQMRER
ncbi:MAG: phage tail tape measure protein, partial [Thermodesulfovibrionia bacterium]|nr:phage tail tape measure protein [Thermodesulfovibrionia bacterium]